MLSIQIKPYCKICKICKPSDQFNLTPNRTYRYTCKICEFDKQKEEAKILYETTKKKLEDQTVQQHQLDEYDYIVYHCPYEDCKLLSIVYKHEINCGIFRCGYNKSTNQQIPQHLPKSECDQLRNNLEIIGCVRPYQLNTMTPIICDYI